MITRQLLSGGAFSTNRPRKIERIQSSQRQRWHVPALRNLGVSHIARRGDLELMGHRRRARAARRPTGSHATHWDVGSRRGIFPVPRCNWLPRRRHGPDNMTDEPIRAPPDLSKTS
jgi:hypothetical protein